jgi:hypothetical protein
MSLTLLLLRGEKVGENHGDGEIPSTALTLI